MCNYTSGCKRFSCLIIFFLLTFVTGFHQRNVAFAIDELENELSQNIDKILEDIDFSDLDEDTYYVPNLNLSFSDFVKNILSGESFYEYNSVISLIKSLIFENIETNLRFFTSLFLVVVLFEIFKSFASDKLKDSKFSIKIIFSFLLSVLILVFVKDFYLQIQAVVDSLFSLANIIFPILISLLTLSGATSSASVFGSFSVFLLETGLYLIKFVLLPLALSILLLSLFSSVFNGGKFSKLTSLFKTIFKYVIVIFFSLFGLLSTVNIISSTSHDGINLKLTKYALKNYVPILGGYVSEGFDFIFSCSVLIKNAVGVCAIVVLLFKVLSPVIFIAFFSLAFKILSVVTGFVGEGSFSDMFDDVSKSFGNFLTVILGGFLIVFVFIFLTILAVGVA